MEELVLKGVPAAPGIAYGPAFILDKQDFIVPKRAILPEEVPIEIARFEEALFKTKEEILALKEKLAQDLPGHNEQIFDAHLLVMEDPILIDQVKKGIKSQKVAAEYVFSKVIKKYVQTFAKIQDEYLKERTSDINDISRRVLKHLMEESKLHDLEGLS